MNICIDLVKIRINQSYHAALCLVPAKIESLKKLERYNEIWKFMCAEKFDVMKKLEV